jgi:hypothetical protein
VLQCALESDYGLYAWECFLDDSPSLITCEKWFGVMEDKALAIRNAVAILMEDATDDTKQRVKEELQ